MDIKPKFPINEQLLNQTYRKGSKLERLSKGFAPTCCLMLVNSCNITDDEKSL